MKVSCPICHCQCTPHTEEYLSDNLRVVDERCENEFYTHYIVLTDNGEKDVFVKHKNPVSTFDQYIMNHESTKEANA